MKKRLLAMLMALALLVSLMPMGVLADGGQGNGGGSEPLSPSSVGNNDVTISKTAERTGEDTWEVTMTVTAKEREIQSEPLELVLLLDRSGSMAWCTENAHQHNDDCYRRYHGEWVLTCRETHVHTGGQACSVVQEDYTLSRQYIAGTAAKDLIDQLAKMGISASVSVVGFSGDDYNTHRVIRQMTPLTTSNADNIKNSIPTSGAEGGTYMNDGLIMANRQFSSDATNKVIVLLADGDCNGTNPNDRDGYVSTLRREGVVVHTIGFTTSNSTLQQIADTTGGKYYTADNADQLAQAFNQIADDLTAMVEDDMGNDVQVVGTPEATNGTVTVSNDGKLSWNPEGGKLEGGQTVTITYTVKLTEAAKNALQAGSNPVDLNGDAVLTYKVGSGSTQTLDFPLPTDTVQVGQLTTQVTLDGVVDSSETGKNVIIYGNDDTFTWTLPETGATIVENGVAYTYIGSTYDGTATTETSVAAEAGSHTLVHNYVSKPTSQDGSPIKIQVYLDGVLVSDDAHVNNYITVTPSEDSAGAASFDDTTDEVTFKMTYYNCKDITFKTVDSTPYVIQGVVADLVYGQSGCDGIVENGDGSVKADNVKGGTTVTVYLRAQYEVVYHYANGTSTDGHYVYAGTSGMESLTDNTGVAEDFEKPTVGESYTDEYDTDAMYLQVCSTSDSHYAPESDSDETCKTHAAADVNGKQESTQIVYKETLANNFTLPALGTAGEGQELDGWFVGSETSTDKIAPQSYYPNGRNLEADDIADTSNDNVINLYATGTTKTYTITVEVVNGTAGGELGDAVTDGSTDTYNVTVNHGDSLTATFAPDDGFALDTVTVDDESDSLTNNSYTFNNVQSSHKITVVYAEDEIGGEDPGEGDDIPDKYQVTVNYVADVGGSITGITSEVLTIRDQNNNLVESGTVTASGSTAAADANYAFDYWTLDDTRIDADATFSNYELTVSGGQTYTFTAHFKANNPDIDITKTASVNGHTLTAGETVEVGDEITYTITVTNDGNVAFENLKVSDDMWGEDVEVEVKIGDVFYPANLAGNETDGYFLYIADEINHPSEFKPGETWTCRYTYKVVDTDAGETITNTAVVDGETDGEDTVEITVNDPSVSINKTVTGYNDKAMEGDELTYTITVTNTGNTKLDVTVSDDMWTYGKVSSAELNGVGIDVTSGKYTIFGLDAGESKAITYTYTVTAQDVAKGKIDNAATADIDGDGMPDDKHEVTTPTGDPSLTVEKTADASTVQVGTPITYTVEVKNDGYSVMNNVVVSDTLWTSDTAIKAIGNVTGEYDTGESKYYIGKLEPGEYVTLTYTYTPTEAGGLENKVTVTSDDLDTVPEDSVIVDVTPEPTPDEPGISVTKTVSDRTPDVGDTITYYINVENTGNTVIDEFTVKDSMWEYGMPIYVDGEPAYVNSDDAYTVKTADLEPGGSITISYTYSVRYADEGDRITNYVTVTTPGDGPSDNDYVIIDVDDITPIVPDPDDDDDDDTVYVPNWLNTTDHFAYLIGYEDGEIKPENNITRAEVATIFFRLLTDDARARFWSSENDYTDVATDSWYNNAISTLSNMGIINGYEDGSFQPNASITRAEFTAIATRFFDYTAEYDGAFNDVASGSWYADYVQAAVDMGLVDGYPDGGFHPNSYITRAEAVTIVNRVLNRVPHEDYLLSTRVMNTWPDNVYGAWYYADMQEATNSHDYDWIRVSGERVEEWTEKLTERDWAALEQQWSTAYSG